MKWVNNSDHSITYHTSSFTADKVALVAASIEWFQANQKMRGEYLYILYAYLQIDGEACDVKNRTKNKSRRQRIVQTHVVFERWINC